MGVSGVILTAGSYVETVAWMKESFVTAELLILLLLITADQTAQLPVVEILLLTLVNSAMKVP